MTRSVLSPPAFSLRFVHVWRRNGLVWRKLALAAALGNLADPMLYLLGLGYGLGAMLPEVGGLPYVTFLAAGMVCSSTMMSASFEAMYSGFSRMHVQKTWDAIMNAPLTLDDVVLGEVAWAASKSVLSGMAVLAVAWALGLVASPLALLLLPLVFLAGLAFAALGLIMTALAPGYDFFTYYFTLAITPMMMVCGVFYPVEQLPAWLQGLVQFLPLTHAVALARPLMSGAAPPDVLTPLLVLTGYAGLGFYLALVLARRRLLQ
jgi:lipooligosaccharide transport system permease protein